MTTERMLQICVSLMAALGTLMLGTSQDSGSLPAVGMLLAFLAFVFTDFLGWFRLNRYAGGTIGIVAVVYSLMQSQTGGLESQFISVANLLIHLQMILLFQRKSRRIYWQLMVLSLMQVVVAAALNLFFMFGPLLVVYTVAALAALLLFFIYRETEHYVGQPEAGKASRPDSEVSYIQVDDAGDQSAGPSSSVSAIRPRRDLVRGGLLRHFGMAAVSTAVLSTAMFLLMPRFGDGVWRTKNSRTKSGYSGEVDLDDSTSIYESPTVVLRVGFTDEATGEPYNVSNEPYLRGGVLNEYRSGKWARDRKIQNGLGKLETPQRIYSAVRQTVTMDKQRAGVIYSVSPVCRLDSTADTIRVNESTQELMYEPAAEDDPAQYVVGTLGISNGLQTDFVPKYYPVIHTTRWQRSARRRLPELAAEADRIIQEGNLTEATTLAKARRLESYFANSGLFQYSLDAVEDRNESDDPVQDFVVNHRTGHCQYFASGLALMLRSQGIPARVVLGYRGGIFNAVGNYYQIREMDAHAWVEAVIPAEELPADEVMPTEGLDGDAWLRLDPTPDSALALNVAAVGPWRARINDAVDYLQLLWSEYVLGLNQKRQREAIYEPIRRFFQSVSTLAFSQEVWIDRVDSLRVRFQGDLFSRRNLQDATIGIVVLTALFYLGRALIRWGWRWGRGLWKSKRNSNRPKVEFYRRLEGILARRGIRRRASETPMEFAVAAEARLQDRFADVAAIPREVVAHFYQVRFGRGKLDDGGHALLERLLRSLEEALARPHADR